mmetsp:Transcript_119213/g.384927  ORF Transcript_119213/g.384927 Transcript_119213/m.384927 type:complete len:301 (+) Transcript_119213:1172-2074(+)
MIAARSRRYLVSWPTVRQWAFTALRKARISATLVTDCAGVDASAGATAVLLAAFTKRVAASSLPNLASHGLAPTDRNALVGTFATEDFLAIGVRPGAATFATTGAFVLNVSAPLLTKGGPFICATGPGRANFAVGTFSATKALTIVGNAGLPAGRAATPFGAAMAVTAPAAGSVPAVNVLAVAAVATAFATLAFAGADHDSLPAGRCEPLAGPPEAGRGDLLSYGAFATRIASRPAAQSPPSPPSPPGSSSNLCTMRLNTSRLMAFPAARSAVPRRQRSNSASGSKACSLKLRGSMILAV